MPRSKGTGTGGPHRIDMLDAAQALGRSHMAEEPSMGAEGFKEIAGESFAALRSCFDKSRVVPATLGLAVSFAVAAGAGVVAGGLLLRDELVAATALGLVGGVALYVGGLLTYTALCFAAMAERQGAGVSAWRALGFAAKRTHVAVGAPMFALVVAMAVGSLAMWTAAEVSGAPGVGAALAPVALILAFAIGLVLISGLVLVHAMTGPCVACLDASLAGAGTRLTQIVHQRIGAFIAAQAAVLAAGLPLAIVTITLVAGAFSPALHAVVTGRVSAQPVVAPGPGAMPLPMDAGDALNPAGQTDPAGGWSLEALGAGAAGAAPMVGVTVVVLLVVCVPLLIFASSAQSAVYLAITGDEVVSIAPAAPEVAGSPRHPPITHCWRCDAITRFEAERCSKCGARLAVCPYCFATNELARDECTNCGKRLPLAPDEESVPEEESVAS